MAKSEKPPISSDRPNVPDNAVDPAPLLARPADIHVWCTPKLDMHEFWRRHPDVAHFEAIFIMGEGGSDAPGYDVELWLTEEAKTLLGV